MEEKIVTLSEPKSRKAALNQAAYALQQIDLHVNRRENIMKNVNATEEKIQKLQKVIEGYRTQIQQVDTTSENWRGTLKKLKDAWNLTDAEILELRSQLIREQIEKLQKEAGVQDTGRSRQY